MPARVCVCLQRCPSRAPALRWVPRPAPTLSSCGATAPAVSSPGHTVLPAPYPPCREHPLTCLHRTGQDPPASARPGEGQTEVSASEFGIFRNHPLFLHVRVVVIMAVTNKLGSAAHGVTSVFIASLWELQKSRMRWFPNPGSHVPAGSCRPGWRCPHGPRLVQTQVAGGGVRQVPSRVRCQQGPRLNS